MLKKSLLYELSIHANFSTIKFDPSVPTNSWTINWPHVNETTRVVPNSSYSSQLLIPTHLASHSVKLFIRIEISQKFLFLHKILFQSHVKNVCGCHFRLFQTNYYWPNKFFPKMFTAFYRELIMMRNVIICFVPFSNSVQIGTLKHFSCCLLRYFKLFPLIFNPNRWFTIVFIYTPTLIKVCIP